METFTLNAPPLQLHRITKRRPSIRLFLFFFLRCRCGGDRKSILHLCGWSERLWHFGERSRYRFFKLNFGLLVKNDMNAPVFFHLKLQLLHDSASLLVAAVANALQYAGSHNIAFVINIVFHQYNALHTDGQRLFRVFQPFVNELRHGFLPTHINGLVDKMLLSFFFCHC